MAGKPGNMLIPIVLFLFILFDLHLPMISMLLFILFMGLEFPLIYYIDHAASWKNILLLSLVFLLIAGILVSVAINRNNLDLAFDSQAIYNYALKRSR